MFAMSRYVLPGASALALLLVACAQKRPETPPSQAEAVPPGPVAKAPLPAPVRPARTVAEYKVHVARRIASASAETFADPLPEVLRSIVVLDIRIDRHGVPQRISVRRSNGIRALERRAEESVRRAGPFDAPSSELLRGTGAVSFLETFLFRDDGRFQIRTLVESP